MMEAVNSVTLTKVPLKWLEKLKGSSLDVINCVRVDMLVFLHSKCAESPTCWQDLHDVVRLLHEQNNTVLHTQACPRLQIGDKQSCPWSSWGCVFLGLELINISSLWCRHPQISFSSWWQWWLLACCCCCS